jgi:flagellar hook-length control protein FliK
MVQGAASVVTTAATSRKSFMSVPASDSDFMSVLKSSEGSIQMASENNGTSRADDSIQFTDKSAESVDETKTDAVNTSFTQDPVETLDRIVNQMAAAAQQAIDNPQPREVSAIMEAVWGQGSESGNISDVCADRAIGDESQLSALFAGQADGSRTQMSVLDGSIKAVDETNSAVVSQIAETPLSANRSLLSAMQNEGAKDNNASGLAGQSPANIATAADKTGHMDNGDNQFQDNQSNADGASRFAQISGKNVSDLAGKNGELISKNSGSFDETLSQLKAEILTDKTTVEVKGSGNTAGLYSQSVQAQDLSVRSGQHIQETIPANRISAVDEVISKAVNTGQSDIVLRIDPPDLGSVHIRLSLDNGVLKADVRVDSAAVKDTFLAAMPQIKNALENSGIKVSDFSVDVRDEQNGNGQTGNNQGKQQQRQDGEAKNAFSDFFA